MIADDFKAIKARMDELAGVRPAVTLEERFAVPTVSGVTSFTALGREWTMISAYEIPKIEWADVVRSVEWTPEFKTPEDRSWWAKYARYSWAANP